MEKIYLVIYYSEENGGAADKRIVGAFTNKEKATTALETEFNDTKQKYGVGDGTRLDEPSVEYVQGEFFYIEDKEYWSVRCSITEVNVDEHLTDVYF